MNKIHLFNVPKMSIISIALLANFCGIKTEPELRNLLKATVKNCDFGDAKGYTNDYGWKIDKCSGDETKKASEWITRNGVIRAIPTLVAAMGEKDVKMVATAVYHFNWNIGLREAPVAQNPAALPDKVARIMLENFKKISTESWSQYAARAITRLAVIKGLDKEITAIAEGLPETASTRHSIYSNLMVFGGMRNYEILKQLSTHKNNTLALVGIRAPASMEKMDDAARNVLCPWWETFLENADPYKSAAAAAQVGNFCSGKSIDKMFNTVEKRLSAVKDVKKLEADYFWAVRYVSCEKNLLNSAVRGTDQQCARKAKLKTRLGIK